MQLMLQNSIITFLLFIFSGSFALILGQNPDISIKPSVVIGEIRTIDENNIVISTDAGPFRVVVTDKSVFKRVSPENPSLTAATPGTISELGVGDKLTVTGIMAADGKSLPARSVYFMTAADIGAKNAKDNDEWQRRGVKGKVISVNPQTNQLGIEISGLTGTTKMILTPKENAKFLRYATDSIRFDEALESTLPEVKVGDMVRAIGDKSSDGLSFSAEKVLAGAFQTTAGTVKSIDPENNQVVIKNLQTNKDVVVVIGQTSVLKRFPAEQAEMLARVQMAGAGGARPMGQVGQQGRGQAAPGGQGRPTGAGQGGFGGARAAGGVDDMLERSPSIGINDLKVGDIIALSSTKTSDVNRIKAIKLFAGVEPFLRAAQASGGGRRGQGGVEAGFSIPGLEGP